MELATTLTSQTVQNAIREIGINPDYWYPVGWANKLQPGHIMPVTIWKQAIAVFRDTGGKLHALEDACAHKGVALHKGQIQGKHLLCPYHGWEFNGAGQCVKIPYLPETHKLPCAQVRSYPVCEKYNLIWVFPGDASLATSIPLPEVPEFDDPDCLMVPIPAHFQAHFTICNENTMDVFHGFLHKNLQGWFDPVLTSLKTTESSVHADYRVSYKGVMTKILGLSDRGDEVTTRTVSLHYQYPHYHSSLEGVSSLYLMRSPMGAAETKSFTLMFLRLNLPKWLVQPFKPLISAYVWRFLFSKFLDQDIEMMESEQRTYSNNPQRRYVEINPAIIALQKVMMRQYEQYRRKTLSSQLSGNQQEESLSLSEAISSGRVESS